MTRRISAEVRSRAALICAVAASTRGYASYYGIHAALGQHEEADEAADEAAPEAAPEAADEAADEAVPEAADDATNLAYAAYDAAALERRHAAGRCIDRDTYATDALAEVMLRTGWTPCRGG